jgi:Fe-S-cluster containining protein
MERKSELCLKCLECCKWIGVVSAIDPNNYFERSFYEIRGCKTFVKDGHLIVIIPFKCHHLTEKGCDIYEKRPLYCKEYDGREDPFMKSKCLWGKDD